MSILGITLARGGSKGVPRKNIRLLNGLPLIGYTIKEALKSEYLDDYIVSTDDEEIKDVVLKYGAEVPFIRPKNIADDFTGTHEVVGHAIEYSVKLLSPQPKSIFTLDSILPSFFLVILL